jgi:hypothetical protein
MCSGLLCRAVSDRKHAADIDTSESVLQLAVVEGIQVRGRELARSDNQRDRGIPVQ